MALDIGERIQLELTDLPKGRWSFPASFSSLASFQLIMLTVTQHFCCKFVNLVRVKNQDLQS